MKPELIARLTARRSDNTLLIIEIRADATFGSFYQYYSQTGNRRSTKKLIRTSNRNEALTPATRAYRMEPGLAAIAERLQQPIYKMSDIKIKILKKHAYKKLLSAAPADLGDLPHVKARPLFNPNAGIAVFIPSSYLTIKKRMDIILGRG